MIREWKNLTESKIRQELEGRHLEDEEPETPGWYCGHCNSFIVHGQMVCTGCQAEVAYEATKHEVINARVRGGVLGELVGGVINFGVPRFFSSHFNFSIPDGWGLGTYSLYIIAVPAILGIILFESFERNKFRNKSPRFFRQRNI
ncbi:TPA: hypothetical protein QH156_000994 [Morganella morganii subsp. morganii]|uniref:hypothetical protein n=1 Tax=Morganella morganii TaxID=582 RepID=UPI001BDB5917|nr:hypothetical protein [Morganella morganii]MBT0363411.1 hypothetical protein [Morganella morganii subsp. morganii]HDS6456023.1 hypothetical protein [Morganella morganii subsp. morganii]